MQLDASRRELFDRLDRDDLMPHCRKRTCIGSYTCSNVENTGRTGSYQVQDGRVVLLKRDVLPLTNE